MKLKTSIRSMTPSKLYLPIANSYRYVRRLYTYPSTANPGTTNYDDYWGKKFSRQAGKMSPWREDRAKIFLSIIESNQRILDLGVGDGAVLKYLIDHKAVEAMGIDISPQAVEFCQKIGINAVLADVNRPINEYLEGEFDYIILSEIIEHLPDPESLLRNLAPHARKGIIISIPNTGYHHHRLRLLFGKFPLQWVVTPGEHLRFWTIGDFRWWIKNIGFSLSDEFPYQGTPVLNKFWPSLFAAGVVYVVKRP